MKHFLSTVLLTLALALPAAAAPTSTANPWAGTPGAKEFPNAEAVVLKDDIQAVVHPDGTHDLIEYDAIKVLTKEGVERFGHTMRTYDATTSKTEVKLARIWSPDGKMTEVPAARITDTVPESLAKSPLYKRMRLVSIDYPGLVEGSVLEFRFLHHRRAPWPGRKFWEVSYTQDFDPILDTAFTFTSPEAMPFDVATPGTPEIRPEQMTRDHGQMTMRWHLKDRPVIPRQPAMPALRELASQVQISNFASWDDFATWARALYDQAAGGDPTIASKAATLVIGQNAEDGKIRAIMTWLDKEKPPASGDVGLEELPPSSAHDALAAPALLPQDRAVLLIALLRAAGVHAYPALMASTDYGDAERGVPSLQQFNRLLVVTPQVDGWTWIDPAAGVPGVLGQGLMGRRAILLDGSAARFVESPVSPPQANREEISGVGRLDADGSMEVSLKIREFGANAVVWKSMAQTVDTREQRQVFQLLVSGINPTAILRDFYLAAPTRPGDPLEITVNFEMSQGVGHLRGSDDFKMTVPVLGQKRLISYAETPVDARKYDVALGATDYEERKLELVVPKDWAVKTTPKSVTVNNAVGSYQVDVRAQEHRVYYFTRLILRKPMVARSAYADFKALLDQVSATQQEYVTLTPPPRPAKPVP